MQACTPPIEKPQMPACRADIHMQCATEYLCTLSRVTGSCACTNEEHATKQDFFGCPAESSGKADMFGLLCWRKDESFLYISPTTGSFLFPVRWEAASSACIPRAMQKFCDMVGRRALFTTPSTHVLSAAVCAWPCAKLLHAEVTLVV